MNIGTYKIDELRGIMEREAIAALTQKPVITYSS